MATKAIIVLIGYVAATAVYVWFFHQYVNSNRILASNDVAGRLITTSLLFLIPLIGLIHLSLLVLSKEMFWKIVKISFAFGLVGPALILVSMALSKNPESAYGGMLLPIVYLALCAFCYAGLLVFYCVRGTVD